MVDPRPYTILSCGMSLDGFLDGGTGSRLVLSNDQDLDRVDALRAASDAVMVGASTVRHDNPRLVVRDVSRRHGRAARGLPPSPAKVTVTAGGELDPSGLFFTTGEGERLVYCPAAVAPALRGSLGTLAHVVGLPGAHDRVDLATVSADLYRRGVRQLMVEGGRRILTQLLLADLVDEIQMTIAPFFVGNPAAVRFVDGGRFPFRPGHRAYLLDTHPVGDMVLLRYALSASARAQGCPATAAAAVGAG